jgi:hypothetical protein
MGRSFSIRQSPTIPLKSSPQLIGSADASLRIDVQR